MKEVKERDLYGACLNDCYQKGKFVKIVEHSGETTIGQTTGYSKEYILEKSTGNELIKAAVQIRANSGGLYRIKIDNIDKLYIQD